LLKQIEELRLQKDVPIDHEEDAVKVRAEWTTESDPLVCKRIYDRINGHGRGIASGLPHDCSLQRTPNLANSPGWSGEA